MSCKRKCMILRGTEQTKNFQSCGGPIYFVEELIVTTDESGRLKKLFYVLENGDEIDVAMTAEECHKMDLAVRLIITKTLATVEDESIQNHVKIQLNGKKNVPISDFLLYFGFQRGKVEVKLKIMSETKSDYICRVIDLNSYLYGYYPDDIIAVSKSEFASGNLMQAVKVV